MRLKLQWQIGLLCTLICLHQGASARLLQQKEAENVSTAGFLADEIPLTVVSTIPDKLLNGGRISVTGHEPLTVVLSRPIVATGSNTGDSVPNELKPFILVPEVTGTYRFLTASIVTFEPAEDWASDLEVEFEWNLDLVSYDGVSFSPGRTSGVQLTTGALELEAVAVHSASALNLTDNFWDAFVGTSFDALPEVPADGSIQIVANSKININALQSSLFIVDTLTNANPAVSVTVRECELPDVPCAECGVGEVSATVEEVEEEEPEYSTTYTLDGYNTDFGVEEESRTETDVTELTAEEVLTDEAPVLTGKSARCLNVSFSAEQEGFLDGRIYQIVLPSDTTYSNQAGPLTDDITIRFAGLRDFRIPFVEDKSFDVRSSQLQIWLPHGLGEGLNITDFPMKIVRASTGQDVPFTIEMITKSIARITGSFTPGSAYKITAFENPNFVDGYGLKLKRSSLNFAAAPIDHFFSTMNVSAKIPFAIFEKEQDWSQSIAVFSKGSALNDKSVCKKEGSTVSLWDVSDEVEALPLLTSDPLKDPVTDYLGLAADAFEDQRKDIAGESSKVDVSKLLGKTGIVASSYCRNDEYHPFVLAESEVQVIVLVTSAITSKGRSAVVWVTNMKDASPVSGAGIGLFAPSTKANSYSLIGEGKTDKEGVASIVIDEGAKEMTAIVSHNGKSVYVPNVEVHNGILTATSDSIILDRPVVRPGETLRVKGYIMQNEAGKFLPSSAKNVKVVVSPSMISYDKDFDEFQVEKFDGDFGSYTARLRIPVGILGVYYKIQVKAEVAGGETYFGKEATFTVADSRQSPARLFIDAPVWTVPDKKFKVDATATSFAGAPIQNGRLTFVWAIEDPFRDADDEILNGRVTALTDSKGEASANIDLGTFKNPPNAGTVLVVTVHYVGSSGEQVKQSQRIRLEPDDVNIDLLTTITTDVPNQKFGVRAEVTDISGKPLKSGEVEYALTEINAYRSNGRPTLRPTTSDKQLGAKSKNKCSKSIKKDDFCTFELPGPGLFVLEACIKNGKNVVCKREYLGKTEEEWKEQPLATHLPLGITPLTEGPYSVGDSASFLMDNPFDEVTVLITWGDVNVVKTKNIKIAPGMSTVKFDVDSTCTNNCAMSITVSVPRQTKGLATELKVPVHGLFDPAMPHTEHFATVIETRRKKSNLGVKVSLPGIEIDKGMPLVEPGVNASVRVTFDTKGPVEITAFAIDLTILDLLPYSLKDVSEDFIADLTTYFSYKSTAEHLVAPGAVEAVIEANNARKELNQWADMISTIQPDESVGSIDLTDDEHLEQYVQFLTVVPRTQEEQAMAITKATAADRDTVENGLKVDIDVNEAETHLPNLDMSSYTVPTLFESFTASGGIWLVNFEGPVKGGDFAIRAYASTGDGSFGSDEIIVRVKDVISLDTDFPVFSRLGDEFKASVTVRLLKTLKDPISLKVELSDNIDLASGPTRKNLILKNKLEEEVEFTFKSNGIGDGVIKITADDGFGHNAIAEVRLTIYGPQSAVVIGSSLPVSAVSNEESVREINVPEALEGSGSIVIAAGNGYLPAMLILADQIYSQDSFSCPISAEFILASIAIPALLDRHNFWSPDPNLLPEFYVELVNSVVPTYVRAMELVNSQSTTPGLGLESEIICLAPGVTKPTGVSIEENAKGIFIVNSVAKRLEEHNLQEVHKNIEPVNEARKTWIKVLEENLVLQAEAALEEDDHIHPSQVAIARLALGASWSPPKGTKSAVVADLSMGRLEKEFDNMSTTCQAYYVLTLLNASKVDKAKVSAAINSWLKRIQVQGSQAYITNGNESVSAENNLANSLVFLALAQAGGNEKVVTSMSYYVTAPMSDSYGFTEYSIFAKTVTMMGLSILDADFKPKKNTNVRIEVRSGTLTLFSAAFTPGRHPVSIDSTPWKDLNKNPAPIEVFPQGNGEINLIVAMKHIPRDTLENPIYKGVYVDRTIQLDSAGPISNRVSQVPLGTVINVRVDFMTPVELEGTTVQVFLPAGVEPVRLGGGEDSEYCPVPFFDLFSEDYYEGCPRQVNLADQVQFVYERVSAGAHSVSFKAVAAIPGSFGVPPARVFVSEDGSVMGLSSATRLDICEEGKKCSVESVETDFVAKECKNNCNENGVCDLSAGKCQCFYGFGGDDCQKAGAV